MSKILIDEATVKMALEYLRQRKLAWNVQIALREALAEQPAQQEPCGYERHEHRPYGAPGEVRIHAVLASQYKMPDGTIANEFQWLIDAYKADPTTIKLLPFYTTSQAQRKPLTLQELEAAWNAQADKFNQWDELGLDEIVAWAQAAHNIKENT